MSNRPKPTALRLVQGNPGKRAINKAEPKPARSKAKMPPHLSPIAKTAWKRLCEVLDRMGVLTEADEYALERLAECYGEIRECTKVIAKVGRTYETANGEGNVMHRPRPEVGQLADADRRFKSYLVEFGLTPAARTKVQGSGEEKDDLDNYFG